MVQQGTQSGSFNGQWPPYRWHDGSTLTYEPLIAWGLTGASDEGMIRGQIWDAAMISGEYPADQTTSFDSHNWWVYTNNSAWSNNVSIGATLVLTIP
jgi:hypothetical protein